MGYTTWPTHPLSKKFTIPPSPQTSIFIFFFCRLSLFLHFSKKNIFFFGGGSLPPGQLTPLKKLQLHKIITHAPPPPPPPTSIFIFLLFFLSLLLYFSKKKNFFGGQLILSQKIHNPPPPHQHPFSSSFSFYLFSFTFQKK